MTRINMKKTLKKPANAERKQGGNTRFKPGQSGNPAGKRPGTRNKDTLAALALLDGESEALTRKAIEEAMGGNITALKLCIDRIIPPARERPVDINFPEITDGSDMAKLTATLLSAVGNGSIDAGQAASLAKIVEIHRNTLEMTEIDKRLQKLEESNEKRN
jgi:hypothetical protein